ncbi:MAG TPA: hypothetical protein VK543_00560 [Puia sp.]|nr:hypothetical protein [Puia sp.]
MNKYLLLRSNKQTGPYTVEELQTMGLKAYDLVWVEGKSAAWRYPGEIEELKSFSPLVEEQPYDRFFKKPTQINQPLFSNTQSAYAPREERNFSTPRKEQESNKSAQSPVYVNLPASKNTRQEEETDPRLVVKKLPVPKQSGTPPIEYRDFQELAFGPGLKTMAGDSISEEKFSPSYPESRKNYSQKTPEAGPGGGSVKNFIRPFAIGFGLAAFLGIGVFIGISINNRKNLTSKDLAQKEDVESRGQQALYRPVKTPVVVPPVTQNDKSAVNNNLLSDNDQQAVNETVLPTEKKKNKSKQKTADSLQFMKPKVAVDSSAMSAVKNIVHATESEQVRKDAVKNKIAELVSVSGNKYNVGTFGGISELQLSISNKSLYPLDLVVVEVQYIQSNKKIFKTENVYFRNISAGSTIMEEAPKSPRGIKVQYRITLINSRELGLSYTGS